METEGKRDKSGQLYTGLEREGAGWAIFLRGRYVGEAKFFTEAKDRLAKLEARATPATPAAPSKAFKTDADTRKLPREGLHGEPLPKPEPKPEAAGLPKELTLIAVRANDNSMDTDGPCSYAGELLALEYDGQARPPKTPTTGRDAEAVLAKLGYRPADTARGWSWRHHHIVQAPPDKPFQSREAVALRLRREVRA